MDAAAVAPGADADNGRAPRRQRLRGWEGDAGAEAVDGQTVVVRLDHLVQQLEQVARRLARQNEKLVILLGRLKPHD